MHTELQVRISHYFSYDADKKLLDKVSNLVKISLFYRAYKYELAYLNKQNHFLTFHSVYYVQFNTLNAMLCLPQNTTPQLNSLVAFISNALHISNSIEEID